MGGSTPSARRRVALPSRELYRGASQAAPGGKKPLVTSLPLASMGGGGGVRSSSSSSGGGVGGIKKEQEEVEGKTKRERPPRRATSVINNRARSLCRLCRLLVLVLFSFYSGAAAATLSPRVCCEALLDVHRNHQLYSGFFFRIIRGFDWVVSP